jgi:hypothetical protein
MSLISYRGLQCLEIRAKSIYMVVIVGDATVETASELIFEPKVR